MRKVTAGLFSSIDGVVEAPNEWQPAFDEEMGAVLSRMLEEQDAVLLGRVTFTEWAGYWPASTDEPFASYINSTQKYVASSTLGSVGQWPNSTLIKGSLTDFIKDLCKYPGDPKKIAEAEQKILEAHAAKLTEELGEPVTVESIRAGKHPRPRVADSCATSLTVLSRSSRAINESCRVAGIAKGGSDPVSS